MLKDGAFAKITSGGEKPGFLVSGAYYTRSNPGWKEGAVLCLAENQSKPGLPGDLLGLRLADLFFAVMSA
jgi:hypothetical protein